MTMCPKHPFTLFDTSHCIREKSYHKKQGEFFRMFAKLLSIIKKNKSYLNLYFDPQDVIRTKDFEKILEVLKENKGWIRNYKDLV